MQKAYVLVFEAFSDFESAHALAGIRRSGKYEVVTVGLTSEPIRSAGGLRVVPDIALKEIDLEQAALLILPGGDLFEQGGRPELIAVLRSLYKGGVPIAAICAATLEVARAGLLQGIGHTSNALEYLQAGVPEYDQKEFYVQEPAVRDGHLITASTPSHLEFARAIFERLETFSAPEIEGWYMLFKGSASPRS